MSVRNRPTALLFAASLLVSVASYAAEYSLDFTGAKALDAEVPVLRRAEMAADVGTAPAVAVGDTLNLKLFGDVTLSAKVAYALPASFAGGRAFSLVLGDGVSSSTFVESPDGLMMELRDIDADRLYNVSVLEGKACVEEIDLSVMRRGGCVEVDTPEPENADDGSDVPVKTKRKLLSATLGNPFDDNIVAPAPVTVDIMLVFDNGAQAWVEKSAKYSSITNFAIAQVAKMNQVLRNTDLHTNFWYRLVDVATVDSRWTVIDTTVLPAMRTGIMESSGIWGEVATRREACGADVVSLIIDTGSAYGTTGIGYITHGTTYDTWVNTYRSWCYSCCAIRSVENDYTLSHEVGHNMGLTHSPTLANWSKSGTFDWCNGYNFTGGDGKHYNTVMAYNYDKDYSDYIEIPFFSSPLHEYKGVPVGTEELNDCTRVLRQTCRGIADWHATTIPLPSDVVFSPAPNDAFVPPTTVTLSTLGGYEIRYTIDGTEPTRESALYEEPLSFAVTTMVKAIAVVDDETISPVFTAVYSPVATGTIARLDAVEGGAAVDWTAAGWTDDKGSDLAGLSWSAAGNYVAYLVSAPTINLDSDVNLKAAVFANDDPITVVADGHNLSAASLEVLGKGVLSGTNYAFTDWRLHPGSSLTLAPGEDKTLAWTKKFSLHDPTSEVVISNGTVETSVAIPSGDSTGAFGHSSVRVANGGVLSLKDGWQTGSGVTAQMVVDQGGTLEIKATRENIKRNLVLNGGDVNIMSTGWALEFMGCRVDVKENSSIRDLSSGSDVHIRYGHVTFDVDDGKTLLFDAQIKSGGYNTEGNGIIKDGSGEIVLKRESTFDGPTIISNGTFTVDYESYTSRGRGFTVGESGTLRLTANGCLTIPALDCRGTIALNVPWTLEVTNAVDVSRTIFKIENPSRFSNGAKLLQAKNITGVDFARLEGVDNSSWYLAVEGNYLVLKEIDGLIIDDYISPYTLTVPEGMGIVRGWEASPWYDFGGTRLREHDWTWDTGATATINAYAATTLNLDTTVGIGTLNVNGAGPVAVVGAANKRFTVATGVQLATGTTFAVNPNGATVSIAKIAGQGTLSVTNGTVSITSTNGLGGSEGGSISIADNATLALSKSCDLYRNVIMNGGTIVLSGGGLDLFATTFTITEDSAITTIDGSQLWLSSGATKFAVDGGKTLSINVPIVHSASCNISKTGTGTVELNGYDGNALTFSGETFVNGGFYLVNATHENNGARYNITGSGTLAGSGAITGTSDTWVSTGGTLGGSLALNNLRLETGAIIGSTHYPAADVVYGALKYEAKSGVTTPITIANGSLTVADGCDVSDFTSAPICISDNGALVLSNDLTVASALFDAGARLVADGMLTVSSAVDVNGVVFSFTPEEGKVFEGGFSKALVSASLGISGCSRLSTEALPPLANGLVWVFKVESGKLCAKVVTEEEAASAVKFMTNSSALSVEDVSGGYSVQGLDTKAITVTMEVVVTNANESVSRQLLSVGIGTHEIRCYKDTDGYIKCIFDNESNAYKNDVSASNLPTGTNTLKFAYYSYANDTYGGTFVYLNGNLVFRGPRLRWSNDLIKSLTVVNDWLEVRQIAVVDMLATTPLPNMTASSASVSYSYPTNTFPNVFGLLPDGAFELTNSVVKANFDVTNTAASISFVASFPESATGALCGLWIVDAQGNLALAAEYLGDGAFDFRYHGYSWDYPNYVDPIKPYTATYVGDSAVSDPHLYTITLSQSEGVKLYQDGELVAHMFTGSTAATLAKDMRFVGPFLFGQGPLGVVSTMPSLTVYASHIAFGTSDPAASADVVRATIPVDEPDTPDDPAPPETPAVVDVLVAYDNGAQAYVANKGVTLSEFAQTQIGKMNEVLVTNRLDRFYTYRLAGVCKVDGVYDNIDTAPALIAAGTGAAVSLRAAREIYGADTVTLLVDVTGNTLGNSSPLNYPNDVASQHECAFSVCSIRAVDTGKQHTMIHENAHNMGCGHARAQSIINSPFEYGRGYYFKDGNVTRHTIMAYGGDNDASWYFSTTSKEFGFTLGDKTNNNARVLKETCGEVAKWREGTAIDIDGVEVGGVTWKTSALYPWTVEGDTIRSYNQTEYGNQCTTPLKTTIEGPKVLSFKHKSYFGGESVAGNNYSHFDVLLDDSPVLTQTECTNSWTDARLIIPDGMHEVTFVFSQRFAMNNSKDYKDGKPEADDVVWLKDIALVDPQTVECAHSSTSDDVDWVFPYDYEATAIDGNLGGIEVVTKGVVETLGFGSTNAVVLSVLAELPEGEKGEIAGCKIEQPAQAWTTGGTFYAFAYANGDGTFSLGHGTTTNHATSTADKVSNWTGLHVWTFAFAAQGGAKLYCDGELLISADDIQWSGSSIADTVTYGDDPRGGWALTGAKVYAVHSDFGDSDDVFDTVSSSVDSVLSSFGCLAEYADESQATKFALLRIYKDTGSVIGKATGECVLRISEIMPKPTDDQKPGDREGMDVNGLESGWVEVENTSDQWADLKDYKFIRTNRSKANSKGDYGNFPSYLVPPYSRAIFYTSERYSNSASMKDSAWATADPNGAKPKLYGEALGNVLVWPDKVNPKKSPFVRLIHTPSGVIADTVVVPSDVPEGYSIIVGEVKESLATERWLCPTPTRGKANAKTDGLTRIGPNAGPLYENRTVDKKGKEVVGAKHDSANEFARVAPPAKSDEAYEITFSFNPVMSPTEAAGFRDEDEISSITLVYRAGLTGAENEVDVDMDADNFDPVDWGHTYKAEIPADKLPGAGQLVQWKFRATDASGNEWTSPSFNNPDDGYEWYGTIVEAPELESATLPTWHMFAEEPHLTQMDKDKDDQDLASVPNYARIAIYDSSTSNYYDYVRIDLRGHTSAKFTKKGHGLRFAKAHPLTMRDIVSGEEIEEIRKTSLISEFADPSYMRQMIAFWLFRKMGNLVPFDFPVRCNLNGEFYQLAFNSERFTDELIEDVYGLDKYGYGYKNVGTLKSGSGTTAGGIEKKTPDDEDESNITVLQDELRSKITAAQNVSGTSEAAKSSTTTDTTGLDNAALTKFVVQKFDLPAWLNYLASAKITQEMDDVWANICAYYDNPDMLEGSRGTGTWMPLGYDFNISFGQYYQGDIGSKIGLMSNQDWFKSHPFYGGNRVRCWKQSGMTGTCNYGNDGFEAVWQSAKFRRLYLRRLRTLMDQELKEPGTPESDTPFMVKMREMANLMRVDAELDLAKWPDDSSDNAIDVWPSGTKPVDMDAGIDDIWNNYVVPRREHLYVTHSVTNTAKAVGYGSNLNAGIPEAQSPIETLAPNFVLAKLSDCVVVSNLNSEVVDMSGWTLKFGVEWTLPAGTVCDANDCVYVVKDRRAYITDHDGELTDQVILGNAEFVDGVMSISLNDTEGQSLNGELKAGETIEFKADSVADANKAVENMTPPLTDADVAAGLEAQYLKVVAEPIDGKDGKYTAVVALNTDTVDAPEIAEPAAECEPVEIEENDKGETTVSVSISNAVKGLWYGYEVADELGDASSFENDVPSFKRATDASHTVTGSLRSQASGFFRVKVLPAKPVDP